MFKLIRATFLGLIAIAFTASSYADITFVSWGGAYTNSQQKAYVDTYISLNPDAKITLKTTTVVLGKSKHK